MRKTSLLAAIFSLVMLVTTQATAARSNNDCCSGMGGARYCDSSAGRVVCNNGFYSSCYCSRTAVMDLQFVAGCCLWQGGVLKIDPVGLVICTDGSVSAICSSITASQNASAW